MRITANSFMPVEAKIIIDGKSYTGEEFNRLVEALRAPSLTADQQVVLEWLEWKRHEGSQPIECLYTLAFGDAIESVIIAYINLTDTEQFQVLAAFAEWGLSTLDN
ncbi:hypothetical protein P7G87_02750 [Enterococcus asini]|uniref:hypothetical protein n=1 Tax=Enterococcus asini TaxID=57732 RepID=UPI00288DD810|nr:hypothetical protein [Enterococcus asini]MDT2783612.1 hypothetical protein [Enterococcus asini]